MRSDHSGVGFGILLITIGVLFMVDRQGYMDFGHSFPLILVVIGLTKIALPCDNALIGVVAGRRGGRVYRSDRVGGGIWLVFVGMMLLANMNHWMSFRDSWPLFIVAGGLGMVFGRRRRFERNADASGDQSGNTGVGTQEGGQWR